MSLTNMQIAAQLDAMSTGAGESTGGTLGYDNVQQPIVGVGTPKDPSLTTPYSKSTNQPGESGEAGESGESGESGEAGDLEVKGKESKKTVSWEEALKSAPPEFADLMKGLRADYTKKTQELAAQRKEMQREREALARAQLQLEQTTELPEYDPWDESTVNARIEREVARRLAEALAPVREQYEQQQTQDAYNSFLTTNPDFRSDVALRKEVQALLESNEALDLETAYWAVKGRRTKAQASAAEQRAKAEREAQKKAATIATGTPRRVGTPVASARDLKGMSAQDIYKLAEAMHKR